jgi:hypothetical protein
MSAPSSTDFAQRLIGIALLAAFLGSAILHCNAQTGRVPTPVRPRSAPYSFPVNVQLTTTLTGNTLDFGAVPLGLVGIQGIPVNVSAGVPIVGIDIADGNGADPSPVYKSVKNQSKEDQACNPVAPPESNPAGTCTIAVGFMPADDHSSVTGTLTVKFWDGSSKQYSLSGKGTTAAACTPPQHTFLPLTLGFKPGELYPFTPKNVPSDLTIELYKAFGSPVRKSVINCFYSTNGLVSYFNQFQSIYNAASGSTTVNADVASLNFTNGMQLTVGTNAQVGSTGSNPGTLVSGVPTLSATAAAQAAQNMLYGGTIYGSDIFPLYFRQSNGLATLTTVAREGVDLQKFNNTSTTATNPSTHTFVGFQGYLQYNSSNNAPNSTDPAGSIFVGGSYGYSYTGHSYSVTNGFGGRVNNQIAQVSAGILINGVVKIAASRAFGPSQTYIDSTSMAQKTINNFQTWSIAIAYQSSGAGKTK